MGNQEISEVTKESIYLALIELMQKQEFNKITVVDIAKRAGVSRMAFYRHYDLKGQILTDHLDELFEQYHKEVSNIKNDVYSFGLHFFIYFRKNHELVQAMIKANLQNELLSKFGFYLEKLFPTIFTIDILKQESMKDFEVTFIVGGLYNLLISWIKNDMIQTDEEMAQVVKKFDIFV